MTTLLSPKSPAKVYRIDKFRVPEPAYREFLARVRETHEFLRTQPGFVEDCVLEKTDGPGGFNFATIAVWESAEAVAAAKTAVAAWRKTTGYDPQEMIARLGIEADLANYEAIDSERAETNTPPAPAAECADVSCSGGAVAAANAAA